MRTSTSRGIVYAGAFVAISIAIILSFRSMPGLVTASSLPFLLVLLVCPVAMFFMMRGMNSRPR